MRFPAPARFRDKNDRRGIPNAISFYFEEPLRRLCLCAGEPQAGSCQVVTLERGGGHPRPSVARQTARCACAPGQMAGATRARPACVRGETVTSSFLAHGKKKGRPLYFLVSTSPTGLCFRSSSSLISLPSLFLRVSHFVWMSAS